MTTSSTLRQSIRQHYLADESQLLEGLIQRADFSGQLRENISASAAQLVSDIRQHSSATMMESFLAEYGLSTREGIALMCLAEALLRVPDSTTIDALIEDKIVPGQWQQHRGHSDSNLVNASTWALLLTGRLIEEDQREGLVGTLKGMVKRLGEPLIRRAVAQAMKELGHQFVLGRNISEAMSNATKLEQQGYSYSYDMLGEAALTEADARRYLAAYLQAIQTLSSACDKGDIRDNPGISVKLSALHPRYDYANKARVMEELVERTLMLAVQAKQANMGFNIDAEEADRLELSLDVIEAVLSRPELAGWDGFGVVVQAFGKRASLVLDWLYQLAERLDRRIMVRLVKGAYWDTEIKRAQVMGLDGYPVYTRKANTDVSYLCCARQLLAMTDRIYPQFATHNAHSVAAILQLAEGRLQSFEFQRLHGMGESLHQAVHQQHNTRCRIYAPVGAHQDLLAYLVRRLLENGANSSFVNQIVDTSISPESVAEDPISKLEALGGQLYNSALPLPAEIFGSQRPNAQGWDITETNTLEALEQQRQAFANHSWQATPITATQWRGAEERVVNNPANPQDFVGSVIESHPEDVELAVSQAKQGFAEWAAIPVPQRTKILQQVADLYEQHSVELFSLLCREAGKTLLDAVGEVREAVDFARYYALEGEKLSAANSGCGVIACVSPWNFPLAIFSGQLLASLAAGNAVIAKPAEQTSLCAARAIELMHQAGIPKAALQLLPGSGASIGSALTSHPQVDGVCFTGSTATAQRINAAMSSQLAPSAPLIAETGGLNAMIVDSTALPEQVVRDVVASAFQSAGQRCSALRVLYLQEDVAEHILQMIYGAMDELVVGNPWQFDCDVGPVIDPAAQQKIQQHCNSYRRRAQLLKQLPTPESGHFVGPAVIKVSGIEELEEEIFGPVLHVATFAAEQLDQVIDAINAKGYGLTFGLHTRLDSRVNHICQRIEVGNLYINRNQIGAVVGSQPFGGEGLSGTGPKAGGPLYVPRLAKREQPSIHFEGCERKVDAEQLKRWIDQVPAATGSEFARAKLAELGIASNSEISLDMSHQSLPGPTGEENNYWRAARGLVICLGGDKASARQQALLALAQGNQALVIQAQASQAVGDLLSSGLAIAALDAELLPEALISAEGFAAVACQAERAKLSEYRSALAKRNGELVTLICELDAPERFVIERHQCVDTTAAGGNASLLAASQ